MGLLVRYVIEILTSREYILVKSAVVLAGLQCLIRINKSTAEKMRKYRLTCNRVVARLMLPKRQHPHEFVPILVKPWCQLMDRRRLICNVNIHVCIRMYIRSDMHISLCRWLSCTKEVHSVESTQMSLRVCVCKTH